MLKSSLEIWLFIKSNDSFVMCSLFKSELNNDKIKLGLS